MPDVRHGASSAAALLLSVAAAGGAAGLGGAVTRPGSDPWYQRLDKPSWQPPGEVFGPVWGVLYATQAVAAWLVWRTGGDIGPALRLYGAQLALNAGWTLVFFGLHRLGWAVIEIAVLWVAIAATVAGFRKHSRRAALLMLPYLVWVTFAAVLTITIWRRNRS
jgi:translocator protein